MNSRERVIAAINHDRPDRVPLDGQFCRESWAKLERHFGTTDAEEVTRALGLDIRYSILEPSATFRERATPSPWQIADLGTGRDNLVILRENGWLEDEYGICRVPSSTGLSFGYTYHPLAQAGLEEVRAYQFPHPEAPERYENVLSDVARWKGSHFITVELSNTFKTSWELRGFEQYLMDLILEPRLAETLAQRALEHRIEQSKQLVRCGADMIVMYGDIAMQEGMMFSPQIWRKYFKPGLRTWLQEVRREGNIYFMFHSDGDIEPVLEDVVEIGFDVINPIQPECMDVVDIKCRFGDRVCLHGTISCQQTLPYGNPEDVEAEVRQRIDCCGKDGGLILSPSNTITPDVSLENILALYLTAENSSLDAAHS